MFNDGYSVEYSKDGEQVCIIPNLTIPTNHFTALINMYIDLGYKRWLPTDGRRGYIFAKEKE
jgi:hypothetical protein